MGLFVLVCCNYCGKDSFSSYSSKAYHVPDPLLLRSGNVPGTRGPGSCQDCSQQLPALDWAAAQDHVLFAVWGEGRGDG